MRIITTVFASLLGTWLLAQAGSVDLGFNPTDLTGGGAHGLNGACRAIALQPDGKILVGGDFSMCNGVDRVRIARMNPDGTLDATFDPGFGANGGVRAIALQPDGKVLVGGLFTYFNGTPCGRVIRLNTDGSVDDTFDIGIGFDQNVFTIAVQDDGRILVGGDFFHFNSGLGRGLVRLNGDGSRDGTFDPGDCGTVYSLALRPDDRVVIGGTFSFIGGVDRRCVAGLNSDGTLDASFAPVGWFSGAVYALAIQPDGRTVVGGMIPGSITRLELNGEVDPTFGAGTSGFGGWDPWVYALAIAEDGKVMAAGRFFTYNGSVCNGLVRLRTNGTIDPDFFTGEGFNAEVFALALGTDGKALVGGFFTEVNGTPRNRIARMLVSASTTSIADLQRPALEVFPNPTSGAVQVRGAIGSSGRISVLNEAGQEALPTIYGGNATTRTLDLSGQARGIYLVRLETSLGVSTRRVVLQ